MSQSATSDNPVPEVAFLTTKDGVPLRYGLFPAQAFPTRGTIMFIQGRSDFIDKYDDVFRELTVAGYGVATFDLRGQGASGRMVADKLTGHVNRFSDYISDTLAVFNGVVRGRMPEPFFLMGYSLGGLIALRLAQEKSDIFAGLVVLAPMVGLIGQIYPEPVIRYLSRLACFAGMAKRRAAEHRQPRDFNRQSLTSDRDRFERVITMAVDDPPYLLGSPTYGWLATSLEAARSVRKEKALKAIAPPALILSAGNDRIIPLQPQKRIAKTLNARHVIIDGAQHDMLQEQDSMRSKALAEIRDFLDGVSRR